MNLEQIVMYEYQCYPINKKDAELRSMSVIIYAKDKEDADRIFNQQAHEFFNQSLNIVKQIKYKGFREVK